MTSPEGLIFAFFTSLKRGTVFVLKWDKPDVLWVLVTPQHFAIYSKTVIFLIEKTIVGLLLQGHMKKKKNNNQKTLRPCISY